MSLPLRRRHQPQGITLLYDDNDILVVDKSAGLLTIGTDNERRKTAYALLTDYVKKGNDKSKARLFIVHRLDQDTSGVLLLAKTEAAKIKLQQNWEQNTKIYQAIAHGQFKEPAGELRSYLTENQAFYVYSTSDTTLGKLCITQYQVIKERNNLSLLALTLVTGRKHQIRVQLADAGHPLFGDKRYGQKDPKEKRLALHAQSLAFVHPTTGQPVRFEAKTPGMFRQLMGL